MDAAPFPDSPALRRIINRHSKDALIDMALRWIPRHRISRLQQEDSSEEEYPDLALDAEDGRISELNFPIARYKQHVATLYQGMREEGSKRAVVDRILGIDWSAGLSLTQIADLDLAYYSQHAGLKTWKALKLNYADRSVTTKVPYDASKIEKMFSHHLAPYFKHHIQVLQETEMTWIRISIHDGLAPNAPPAPANVVYFIWFLNSEYLLGVTIKAEWKEFILEALLRLFQASEIEEWPLAGKSPTSLAELLLRKDSQGSHSRYRLNQLDHNPLSTASRKRKVQDPLERYTGGMQDIRTEDLSKIAMRDRFVAADFGPNPQPSLQRVDLQLNMPYTAKSKNFTLGRLTKEPFPIKVVLEGANVLEGIKSLIPLGVAQSPLPKFFRELHSMASSSVTVDVEGEEQRILIGE